MQTRFLDSTDVTEHSPMDELVDAVDASFAAYQRGDAIMPPKSYVELPEYNGDFRSMPAYLDTEEWDAAGVKWVNVHPDNDEKFDLPTVMGTMIYSDPENGYPLAVMDGTALTMRRTGAAAAVATNYLAVSDATTLGIIGAGVQSYTQLEAIAEVRPIEDVYVSDVDDDAVAAFASTFEDDFTVHRASIDEAASCDVLSTTTPVREPIVSKADLSDHTHVNAMGADAEGKQELSDEVLLDAKIVIDDYEQTTHSGEINVPWNADVLDNRDIYAQIGEIVTGERDGRTTADGVTVFDSTGLAIQDVAAARVVYEHASEGEKEAAPFVQPSM